MVVAIGILALSNSGIIPKLLGERRAHQASERERLSEDQRQLIANYETEAANQRRWRDEDADRYEHRIGALEQRVDRQEQTIAKLASAVESSERGNARLRHSLNDAFQYIAALRDGFIRRGERPPPYNGWRQALGIAVDLDEKLRALFEDSGENADEFGDVLVVDDDPSWTRALSRGIRTLGHIARIVHRGQEALSILREGAIRLCVLDIALADMNGVDIAIQARREGVDTPIIAVSGAAEDLSTSSERVREAQFAAVLTKTSWQEILAEIKKHLA